MSSFVTMTSSRLQFMHSAACGTGFSSDTAGGLQVYGVQQWQSFFAVDGRLHCVQLLRQQGRALLL
jgi:hypothetical protein